MCDALDSEPLEEETPLERSDLALETQIVFDLYDKLPDKLEGFSGQYLGKDLTLLPILFNEFDTDISIRKYCWNIIPLIDMYVAQDIAEQIKRKTGKQGDMPRGSNS